MSVERNTGFPARKEMRRQVKRDIMSLRHTRAASAGEHRHVDEAHDRTAVDRAAHVHMRFGREYPGHSVSRTVWLEQEPAGRPSKRAAREIAPTVPAGIVLVG